ncbi:MAG TPA: carbonic anhydrase [Gemmatimonadales bacterium]|nr:carbonic anhydrase [Gemmatimonadales bacterium]
MSASDDLLRANDEYARAFTWGDLPRPPAKRLAIVTCMDARIFPSRAFGLQAGDAHIIRNAGGRARDALRSLIISERLQGTTEIAVIHHTDCGLLTINNQDFQARLKEELGADASDIDFLPFSDVEESVREDIAFLISCPLIPAHVTVRGFVYDVRNGRLKEVHHEMADETAMLSEAKDPSLRPG